jgi:uncharacterized protein (DUF983 family)
VCGLRYEVEPGFFYGAMYISYGMTVGFMVTMLIAIFVLGNDPDLWVYLAIIIPLNLLCVPLFFRYARVLMLHWFAGIKYDPRTAQ